MCDRWDVELDQALQRAKVRNDGKLLYVGKRFPNAPIDPRSIEHDRRRIQTFRDLCHQRERALSALVAGKRVEVEPFQQDRYKRLVGIVYVGELNVNAELIRKGHAWAYRQYMRRADAKLCAYEAEARLADRGLWKEQTKNSKHRGNGATRSLNG